MTRRTGVRAAAAAALLLPLLAAGCGIKETGVVESGRPASVTVAGPPDVDVVYFVAPDGRLAPTVPVAGPHVATGVLLSRLLAGPDAEARAAGLTTALHAPGGKAAVPPRVERDEQDRLLVRLPSFRNAELSGTAKNQLVCTAALSADHTGTTEVVLLAADGATAPLRCPLAR
ncbi:hypothetical protein ABZY31_05105 [Streptomyces sp. NPDC006529]|uniref:hypothetical protein n=1 Tax=Streptomyces sp. NPDC006529 TaxID=3157177 RepID=UPI0033A159B3